MIRERFDNGWQFADAGECRDIFDDPPVFKPVQLPHDAMIYGKRREGSINENTTGFFSGSTYVYMDAMVYVNEE